MAFIFLDDSLHHFEQEGIVDTQQLAVTGGATQQTTQHIAASFVAGQHTVGDHKGGCPDMIGDHTQAYIGLI